jgi:CNT family concentrative nucleoside transporter
MSALGLLAFLGLAWLLAEVRRWPSLRLLAWGLGLQFALGVLVLRTEAGRWFFQGVKQAFDLVTDASAAGAGFVFGNLTQVFVLERVLVPGAGGLEPATMFPVAAVLAFKVLPVIIFVSGLAGILQHLGVVQAVVRVLAWLMRRTLKTSGAETFGAALLVFLGIESMSALGGYLRTMTRSEIFVLMVAFLATIAASVMVAYAGFGAEPGHLLAASLMSAPAAILIAKLMVPEAGTPETAGAVRVTMPVESHNVFDGAARGAAMGMTMALNVAAMLITFVGLVYLLDLGTVAITGQGLTPLMGYVFRPFALLMGISWADSAAVAELLATKTVFNEFLAYQNMQPMIADGRISPRSAAIATYALCGFANPGSLGILIGGLSGLAPERRGEFSSLLLRAFIGGTLAAFTTACVAGVLV